MQAQYQTRCGTRIHYTLRRSARKNIIVRSGGGSLNAIEECEDDMLDRAWGLTPQSRLSCQAMVGQEDLVVEIPRYSINHAKENH